MTQLLLLVGLLSLGPMLVTNLIGYLRSRDDLATLSIQSLESSARVASLQTRLFIEEKRHLVPALVAGNEHLRETVHSALYRLASTGTLSESGALDAHLAAKAEQADDAVEFYVLTTDGVLLGSSDPRANRAAVPPGDPCGSSSGLGGTTTAVSYVGDDPFYHVGLPIGDGYGSVLGRFCARFRFDVHDELRRLAGSQSPQRRFVLATTAGRVVCGSSDGHHGTDTVPAELRGPLARGEHWSGRYIAGAQAAERSGLVRAGWGSEAAGGHDQPRLAAIAPVGGTDWMALAELPEQDALAPLDELKERAIWIGAGFGLLVLFGIALTIRTTAVPLKDLLHATRQMGDGELDQRVEARGPREVAELAEVFNTMSRTVTDLRDTLEERVRQRTRQLEERSEELRRNQAFSELVFNAMDDNLVVLDASMTIMKANAAALRTYGEDIVGQPCYAVFDGRETMCPQCPVRGVFGSDQPVFEEVVYTGQGSAEIMEIEVLPLPSEHQGVGRVLMVSRKITEQKSQQAQMAHHEKMSAFALLSASIAHEIGNPLSSIKAQLRLASELDEPEFTGKTLAVVDGEVDRISRMLRQVVNFARRRKTEETLVSWNQVAEDTVQLLRHNPRGRYVDIELDLSPDVPPVRADEDRMLQVLLNLGLNAIDAVDGRGQVRIQTGIADDGQVCLWVRDTGPGVAAEVRERIFEPYFTTKPSEKGTGLGLFVSRRLVEELGGTIAYVDDGQGATFLVRLPRATRRTGRLSGRSETSDEA